MNFSLRHLTLAALMLAASAVASFASALTDADAAFAAEDYPAAMRAYEAALSSEGPSAGLYYNLAMTQLKQGQPAEASLSLRRAILLDPRMVDARVALSDLERSQGIPAVTGGWTKHWRQILAEKIPLAPLTITGSVIAWAGAFVMLFAIFRSRRKLWPVVGAFALLAIGKGLFFVGYLADPRVSQRQAAVVLDAAGATLLSAPADQSGVVIKMPAGSSVYVHRRSGDWTYCETPNGEKGWTATKILERVVPTA
jgi:tetratricopeptide (TPR) repeat protein